MKKVSFIILLVLASASAVSAQSTMTSRLPISAQLPQLPNPHESWIIVSAEADRMQTFNEKGKPHLKSTDMDKLNQQNEISLQSLHEQEIRNNSAQNVPEVQMAYENYCATLKLMKKVEKQKLEAEMTLATLTEKQQREKAKLQVKIDKWESKCMNYDQMKKAEDKLLRLEEKHSRQITKARENLTKAINEYDCAIKNFDNARMEMEKYR